MEIQIPGVPKKYNSLAIAAIIIMAIIILFPGIISSIIKGVGKGVIDGVGGIIGKPPPPQSYTDAQAWLSNYAKSGAPAAWDSNLYDSNSGAASIDATTAANLWQNVKDTIGWFSNDISGLKAKFSAVVGNKIDISRVSELCLQDENKDLLTYLYENYQTSDPIELMQFVQWVESLPTY